MRRDIKVFGVDERVRTCPMGRSMAWPTPGCQGTRVIDQRIPDNVGRQPHLDPPILSRLQHSIQEVKHDTTPLLPLVKQHPSHLRTVHLQPELKLYTCGSPPCSSEKEYPYLCRTRSAVEYSRSAGTTVTSSDPLSTCRAPLFHPSA